MVPGKYSEIGWYYLDNLPPDIVGYIRTGLLARTRQGFCQSTRA